MRMCDWSSDVCSSDLLAGEALLLLGEIAGEPERACDRAAVMRHEAGRGIDVEGVDFLRAVVRDGFDIHPAFGRDDESNAAGDAIDKQGEVEFVRDIDDVGEEIGRASCRDRGCQYE